MVKVQATPEIKPTKKLRFFHFEAFWMRDPNCEDIIRSSWDLFFFGTPMFKLTQKFEAVRMAMLQWGGGNARSLIKSIEVKKYLLANLETECQAEPSNQQLSQKKKFY